MDKQKKERSIADLREKFENKEINTVIVTHYQGLTVSQLTKLRSSLREVGATFNIVKNNLAKIASKGTIYEELSSHFSGPVGIAISRDPVAASKKLVDFSKDNKSFLVTAAVVDKKLLDTAAIDVLSKLPSLDELRAKLLAVISAPAKGVVSVVHAPSSQIARVIKAYAEK